MHVTLRGPYRQGEDPIAPSDLAAMDAALAGAEIILAGTGRFRRRDRHTVYLRAEDGELARLGDAPDRDYLPHATLLSARDRLMANELDSRLRPLPPLNVRVSSIASVIVGKVDCPLDGAVVRAAESARLLTPQSARVADSPRATHDARLTAIEEIIAAIREGSRRADAYP